VTNILNIYATNNFLPSTTVKLQIEAGSRLQAGSRK